MSKREKIMLIVLAVVMVLSGGYTAYAYRDRLFGKKLVATPVVTTNTNTNNSNLNENTNSNKVVVTPIVDAGVSWISPEKLANLNLFVQKDNFDCDVAAMKYFKTANLVSGGEIILVRASCGMGGEYNIIFKKDKEGKYYYLTKHNESNGLSLAQPEDYLAEYGSKTTIDRTISYSSILPPDALTTEEGLQLKKSASSSSSTAFFSDIKNATKAGITNYGSLYSVLGDSNDAITSQTFVVKLADTMTVTYNLVIPFMLDDNVANVTLNGKKNTSAYVKSLSVACGSHSLQSILRPSSDLASRLTPFGSTADGDTLYYVKNENDSIIDYAYNFYKTGREESAISRSDFYAKKPIFFWKNSLGDYLVFLSQEYAPLAECGKPVVYLYPEKATKVSVSVGASITESDPDYGKGWNVLAYPSGKLTLGGKTYDSLFWEGQGNGQYPEVKSGFIVASTNVKSTLIDHLTRLGLNEKEKNDFLEFWLPKMPQSPLVRLTWFGTREMDVLAPLNVVPKPDTSIRIFLDYEGLQKETEMKPQYLFSPVRKGFTLVEWGGLLKGN